MVTYDFSTKPNQVLLFMDLLGFTAALLRDDTADAQKSEENFIVNYKAVFESISNIKETMDSSVKFLWMSDSLMFSTDISHFDKLLPYLFTISKKMLVDAVPVRGAICVGNLYHKENIWGEALARANKIEKEVAVYPRIMIPKNNFSNLVIPKNYKDYFVRDEKLKDYIYVDTLAYELDEQVHQYEGKKETQLGSMLDVICKRINENRVANTAVEKWNWLANEAEINLKKREKVVTDILNSEKAKGKRVKEFDDYIKMLQPVP